MSYSYTISESRSFTVTHARHIATKVATDLKRMQRFYGSPTDTQIQMYETEVIELLKGGYLDVVTYGFRRHGNWIEPTVRYAARDLAGDSGDDDPGRVVPGRDVEGATFYSFLTYSSDWHILPDAERETVRRNLPFERSGAPEPGITGYLVRDRTYSAGGRALDRSSVRSY